jgi:hypothetical protein
MTLHHAKYNREAKKLQIERVDLKDKKVTGKWSFAINIKGVKHLWVIKFHQGMGNALAHSITEQELENDRLKKIISELEDALSLRPLFAELLSIITPYEFPKEVAR